jgi:hypothetical protein
VLADGERVVGAVAAREGSYGEAVIETLVLAEEYRDRQLEPWMVARAGTWAATNGFHTVRVPANLVAPALERDLEELGYFAEDGEYVCRDSERLVQR